MKYFITIDFSPFYIQLHIEDMLCIYANVQSSVITLKILKIHRWKNTCTLFVHVISTLLAENKVIDIKD